MIIESCSSYVRELEKNRKLTGDSIKQMRSVRWAEFDAFIADLTKVIRRISLIEIVTPANVQEMRTRWLEKANYGTFIDPSEEFLYDERTLSNAILRKREIYRMLRRLYGLKPRDQLEKLLVQLVKIILEDEILPTIAVAESIQNRSTQDTMFALFQIYGRLSAETAYDADEYLDSYRSLRHMLEKSDSWMVEDAVYGLRYSASDIVALFWQLLRDWRVQWAIYVSEKATNIELCGRSLNGGRQIVIPKDEQLSATQVNVAAQRFLNVSLRQMLNGEVIFHGLGGGAFQAEENMLSEGLAEYCMNRFNLQMFDIDLKPSPFSVVAMNRALRGEDLPNIAQEIYEVYRELGNVKKKALEYTWNILYRALFRGKTCAGSYMFLREKSGIEGYRLVSMLDDKDMLNLVRIGAFSRKALLAITQSLVVVEEDLPVADLEDVIS